MAVESEVEYFNGRGGLLVPTLEAAKDRSELDDPSVLRFFHKLWELNGKDISTDEYDGSVYRGKPYSHEFVLPAVDDKPLIVIRGTWKPKDSALLNYEMRRDSERRPSNLGVEKGLEQHSVLLPPEQMGEFVPFVEIKDTHYYYSGGSGRNRSGIYLSWHNDSMSDLDFGPDISEVGTEELSVQEYGRQLRENYSKFIGDTVLKETIALLS
jgi:hypothetical protein